MPFSGDLPNPEIEPVHFHSLEHEEAMNAAYSGYVYTRAIRSAGARPLGAWPSVAPLPCPSPTAPGTRTLVPRRE